MARKNCINNTLLRADSPQPSIRPIFDSYPNTLSMMSIIAPCIPLMAITGRPWKLKRTASTSPFTMPVMVAVPVFLSRSAVIVIIIRCSPARTCPVPIGRSGIVFR